MGKHDETECHVLARLKDAKGAVRQASREANSGCPLHPLARHNAEQCHVLKQHPQLASALVAIGTESSEPTATFDAAHALLTKYPRLANVLQRNPNLATALIASDEPSPIDEIGHTGPIAW
jgi:hypothetical protein